MGLLRTSNVANILKLQSSISSSDTTIQLDGKVPVDSYIALITPTNTVEVIKVLAVSGNTITNCTRAFYDGVSSAHLAPKSVYVLVSISLVDSNDIASILDYGRVGYDDDSLLDKLITSGSMYVSLSGKTLNLYKSHIYTGYNGVIDLAGGKIIQNTTETNTIKFSSGTPTIQNGTIDGNNKSPRILEFVGCTSPIITNINCLNGYGNTQQCNLLTLENCDGGKVYNYKGIGAFSVANAVFGDNLGSSRGLQIYRTTAATSPTYLDKIYLESILGEEGDALQILGYDGSNFVDMLVEIGYIRVYNSTRRGCKVQGKKVSINQFVHKNTLTLAETPNAVASLNIINSSDVVVRTVDIDCSSNFVGIQASGNASVSCDNLQILGGKINGGTGYSFFGDYLTNLELENVRFNCSTGNGVGIQNSTNGEVTGLLFKGGTATTELDINIISNCSSMVLRDNKRLSGTRGALIRNYSPNAIITDNFTTGNATVETAASATGSLIKRNICKGGTAVVSGTTTGQTVLDNDLI